MDKERVQYLLETMRVLHPEIDTDFREAIKHELAKEFDMLPKQTTTVVH